ncbi:hypothetical protein T12_15356 [Trichinella patagoniensis]|uniref:Uncharacterized protein n=1 Tax=Trichinella patagoniensis TaxID=990121 RepID=A0A0V0XET2_9BILA|nr:hypothetical protein T12_15356 [Trichinella patagoniensis]
MVCLVGLFCCAFGVSSSELSSELSSSSLLLLSFLAILMTGLLAFNPANSLPLSLCLVV